MSVECNNLVSASRCDLTKRRENFLKYLTGLELLCVSSGLLQSLTTLVCIIAFLNRKHQHQALERVCGQQ